MPTSNLTPLEQHCWTFVEERIPGMRKGCSVPAYVHSQRVFNLLKDFGYAEEVRVGGLLHDVIEDAGVTVEELKALGCSDRTIELVLLATHDVKLKHGDDQWVMLLAQLIQADDLDAWAIKTADILDNVRSCMSMAPHRRAFMHHVKGPLFLSLIRKKNLHDGLFQALKEVVDNGIEKECQMSP